MKKVVGYYEQQLSTSSGDNVPLFLLTPVYDTSTENGSFQVQVIAHGEYTWISIDEKDFIRKDKLAQRKAK